jgi:hypothetical protein
MDGGKKPSPAEIKVSAGAAWSKGRVANLFVRS